MCVLTKPIEKQAYRNQRTYIKGGSMPILNLSTFAIFSGLKTFFQNSA